MEKIQYIFKKYSISHSDYSLSSSNLFFASHNNTFSVFFYFYHFYALYATLLITLLIVPNLFAFSLVTPPYLISLFIQCRIICS